MPGGPIRLSRRAAEAIKANPKKSDRAIAADIGVNQKTVGAARRSAEEYSSPERIGRDGKSYSIRHRSHVRRPGLLWSAILPAGIIGQAAGAQSGKLPGFRWVSAQ
jgi:hypothetical protein